MQTDLLGLALVLLAVALALRFARRFLAMLRQKQAARERAAMIAAVDWNRPRRVSSNRRSKLDKFLFG